MSAAAPVRRPVPAARPTSLRPDHPAEPPAPRARPTLPRPRLVLVSAHRSTAGRVPFLIVVGALMVSGLVSVLMLHTVAAQDAFRVTDLQQRLATLSDQEQQEAQLVADDSSPTALATRAAALGMVPTTVTKFRRLPNGRTIGVQKPVYVAPPAPVVTHTTPPATHTKPATTKAKKAAGAPTATSATTNRTGHATGGSGSAGHHTPPAHRATQGATHRAKPPTHGHGG